MTEPVVIVGAGPVGLMLACELGTQRIPCIVLERRPGATQEAPGMAINPTVIELLEQRGVMELLRPYGFEFPRSHFAQLWLDPEKISSPYKYNFAIPQSRLQACLEERAAELGVQIRRGHEVSALSQDDTGVTLTARTDAGDTSVRGQFAVGCDGRFSTVRELAEISFQGSDFPFHGIVGDLEAAQDSELFTLLGAHEYPGGLLTVGPSGPGLLRVATAEFGLEPPDRHAPVLLDEVHESLYRLTGAHLRAGQPHWLTRWDVATRQAQRYRVNRIFLAGDAAHTHFPLGGQAMSTGIEDAVNLGWKLAAAIHGWAPADLLDTYQAERHPAGARACLTTAAQMTLLSPLEKVAPLRQVITELIRLDDVNKYFLEMVYGFDVQYPMTYSLPATPGQDLVGRRIPHVKVRTSSAELPLAELLNRGRGFALQLTGPSPQPLDIGGWQDRVDLVTAEPTQELGVSLLVVRPDGRIVWAEPEPRGEEFKVALTTWFGEPTANAQTRYAHAIAKT